ncbi:hypothetical protein F2Q70_00021462 [Brassica cretica]|uniref:Uncharacterized protein n=2 Tax=Brassica cretica TaxID=69181 RepID=A0A8S9GZJ9_BRACR|nr:hypothetical protein F2Q70_00021462 [Brassica cretica]KAF2558971.1 hypothetical protein F2Q68_00015014 [Brassica cretica]KAF3604819.1 hypothetical protein DY000_02047755 [Brassica cretica]
MDQMRRTLSRATLDFEFSRSLCWLRHIRRRARWKEQDLDQLSLSLCSAPDLQIIPPDKAIGNTDLDAVVALTLKWRTMMAITPITMAAAALTAIKEEILRKPSSSDQAQPRFSDVQNKSFRERRAELLSQLPLMERLQSSFLFCSSKSFRFETWRWRLKPVRKHSPTNSNQGQTCELRGIDSRALLQSLPSFVAIRGPILFNQSRRDRSCWLLLLTELRSRFSVASSKAENFRVHDCR